MYKQSFNGASCARGLLDTGSFLRFGMRVARLLPVSTLAGALFLHAPSTSQGAVLAHYEFDGNFLNEVDNAAASTSGLSPLSFVSGPTTLGQAVSFIDNQGHEVWRNIQSAGLSFSSMTVAFWIKTTQANWRVPLTIEASTGHLILIQINGSGTPNLSNNNGLLGAVNISTAGNPDAHVSDGNWNHVAWTANSTANSSILYVNGVQVGSSTWGATTGVKLWMLGKEKDVTQRNYNGAIDDFRLYNEVLTQNQIQDLIPVIPEPSTVVLLAFSGLLLGRRWIHKANLRS